MELDGTAFLDLVQHWMLTEFEMKDDVRAQVKRSLVGPLRTMGEKGSTIPSWAPAWWHGDEDATASNMAAMKALAPRR